MLFSLITIGTIWYAIFAIERKRRQTNKQTTNQLVIKNMLFSSIQYDICYIFAIEKKSKTNNQTQLLLINS
jgi:hypothetical protein